MNPFRGEFELKIRNKKLKGVFNMNALRLTLRAENIELDKFDEYLASDPLTALPTVAYFSILSECLRTDKEFKMKREAFIAEFFETKGALEAVTEAITVAMNAAAGDDEEGND
jgi:hypothetical protein